MNAVGYEISRRVAGASKPPHQDTEPFQERMMDATTKALTKIDRLYRKQLAHQTREAAPS